jgi:hypothetical protein
MIMSRTRVTTSSCSVRRTMGAMSPVKLGAAWFMVLQM